MTEKRRAELVRLSASLGADFADLSLVDEALTHPSYANEARGHAAHNERLEFLGDAVLELAISTYLYAAYPRCAEGELTKMRASLVQSETLARLARQLHLGAHLRMGRGEMLGGGAERQNNLENVFEAVIGAVYLDRGWDAARAYVQRQFVDELPHLRQEHVAQDYKTMLQEYVQGHDHETIAYEQVAESGPDHDKRFTMRVRIGTASLGEGTGRSKKEAEQHAAAAALERLRRGEKYGESMQQS